MYVNKCIKCGREFETKNPKRVICPDCLYPDKNMIVSQSSTPQEVEVGDILECNWGYSMSLVDYYKVIERKKASIKLAKLETKIVSGDGGRGTCIPTDKTKPDQYVDGKLFRIGYKYDNKVVCSVNGHSCYYWDGKPGSFDTWD